MNNATEKTSSRFADVYGSPGQGPRTLGPLRVFWPLAPICLAAGYLLRAALPVPSLSTAQAGFLLLALAVVLSLFIGWSARRLRSFLKGAEGEEKVARILSFLPANHTVFNDLELDGQGADFDHVVVAPSGVFVIETKSWSGEIAFENGQVLCNGQPPNRSPLKQVREAAARLADHLAATRCPEVPIYPVLCFVDNQLKDGLVNIGGVRICTNANLHSLFENSLETPLGDGTLAMVAGELARCAEGG
ncbi:MAG: NERD domain-containing protein [Verrucomicrobia bacterium]|nr:NERD domain-containing protein [Verrucomicrobiota bacterium]